MQALAERLMALATAIHRELSLASADSSTAQWHTIIHGDFKTANLFFSPTAGLKPSLRFEQSVTGLLLLCDADGVLQTRLLECSAESCWLHCRFARCSYAFHYACLSDSYYPLGGFPMMYALTAPPPCRCSIIKTSI